MSENIGNKINISCFFIKGGTVGTSKLMRGYMLGGAVVGGVSGYVGGAIATSGIPMANTVAIAGSSLVNSVGTWLIPVDKRRYQSVLVQSLTTLRMEILDISAKKGILYWRISEYGLGALANLS